MALFATGLFADGLFADGLFVEESGPDTTPNQFYFNSLGNQVQSTLVESNIVTLSGFDTNTAVSFAEDGHTSGQYRKNGGSWTDLGADTADSGDTFQLRLTTGADFSIGFGIQVTIGGVVSNWVLTTASDPSLVSPKLIHPTSDAGIKPVIGSIL